LGEQEVKEWRGNETCWFSLHACHDGLNDLGGDLDGDLRIEGSDGRFPSERGLDHGFGVPFSMKELREGSAHARKKKRRMSRVK